MTPALLATTTALVLGPLMVLATSAGWSGLDVIRKELSGRFAPVPLIVLLNLGLLPTFAAWWWFGVPAGEGGVSDPGAYALVAGGALALQIIANLTFLLAVRVSPFSLTIPFLSLTPVFATIAGRLILAEQPRAVQIGGMVLVVLGALTLGLSEDAGDSDEGEAGEAGKPEPWPWYVRPLQIFAREPGAWMMTLVAACWGATASLDKIALGYASLPLHALTQVGGVTLAAALWLVIRGRTAELKVSEARDFRWLGLAIVFGTLAIGAQLLAIQHVMISMVETCKRAIGLASAVVLGRLMFGEAVTSAKIVAVVVMAAGVALISFG